jgi:arylsulfatase A-like enzyme
MTFDGSQQTFPKLLQKAGYQTAIVGKWHLKSRPQGFDYDEVLPGQGAYYNPVFIKRGENITHEGYNTDITTDLGLDWLQKERDKKKPFMLMLQYKAPHRNWQPGPKHLTLFDDVTIPEPANLFDDYSGRGTAAKEQDMSIEKTMNETDLKLNQPRNFTDKQLKAWNAAYGPKNEAFEKANLSGRELVKWKYQRYIKDYLRCIRSVDENIGRVLKYLDKSGLAENTVVMYSSDQGFYLGEHGWFDKRFMYEESFGTPLLVKWPGKLKPGQKSDALVQNLDFAPTFLDIAGVKVPDDMQGLSLKPVLTGEGELDRKSLYYHYYEYPAVHSVKRHEGVADGRYKLIHFYDIDEWEFYDLRKDPAEMKSEYYNPGYANKIIEMKAELVRLKKHYKVTPPPPLKQPRKKVEAGWKNLFDGKSFKGWKASENKGTWKVKDGMLVCNGARSHLFYMGDKEPFVNFEFKADVMTEPGSNAGIFFHTKYQETGWPKFGYETQVNNTHKDWKKTGSLYGVMNVTHPPTKDNKWWNQHIIVQGKRVIIKLDGKTVVDFTEPDGQEAFSEGFERRLGKGTIALQGHDPGSTAYFKNLMIKRLP